MEESKIRGSKLRMRSKLRDQWKIGRMNDRYKNMIIWGVRKEECFYG